MTSRTGDPRIRRELETVQAMIGIYCQGQHQTTDALCATCQALWDDTRRRVGGCRFRDEKPTCLSCPVHCFKPLRREQIRKVMRYAGPRMALRHPILSFFHLLDGRRARKRN